MRPVLLALLLLASVATAVAQSPATAPATPLGSLLGADGRLDLDRARGAGTLDLAGFDVRLAPDGLQAVPQAPDAARVPGAWEAVGAVGAPHVEGPVNALAVAPDGTVYAGGQFSLIGGVSAASVAAWDGSAWTPLGTGTSNTVRALAVAADGTLYAGGSFTFIGGVSASRVARWDGTAWSALGTGLNAEVRALAVAPGGTLYAGGAFTTAGGAPANRVAAWSGSAWSALGSGVDNTVNTLAVAPDGTLYAGGTFTTAGGASAARVAAWSGSAWSALGAGTNGEVHALLVAPDGTLYAGGAFTTAGGAAAVRVASYAPGPGTWSDLGLPVVSGGLSQSVRALALIGTTLYAAGRFDATAGLDGPRNVGAYDTVAGTWSRLGTGLPRTAWALAVAGGALVVASDGLSPGDDLVMAWTGSAWDPLGPTTWDERIEHVAVAPDGTVYAGGTFSLTPDGFAWGLARFDGTTWGAVGAATADDVNGLAVASDGTLYVLGDLVLPDAPTARTVLASWNGAAWESIATASTFAFGIALRLAPDGTVYAAWTNPPAGPTVYAWDGAALTAVGSSLSINLYDLLATADGTLFVAGSDFEFSAPEVLRWNGTAWVSVAAGLTGNAVYALAELGDGRLAAGGSLTTAGGAPTGAVAVWDGSAWAPFGSGIAGAVQALAVDVQGVLHAGGQIGMPGGVSVGHMIYDLGTDAWTTVDGGLGGPGLSLVTDLDVTPTGDVFAVGRFSTAGGAPVSNIAAVRVVVGPPLPTDAGWSPLGAGAGASVRAVVVAPDGTVYAGGAFTTIGGVPANRVAAWDGFAWSALGDGVNNTVVALTLGLDGALVAGGIFTTAGGAPASRVARWDGAAWSALGSGVNNTVNALAAGPDGAIYAGGTFTTAGGAPAARVARWSGTAWSALGSGVSATVNALAVGLDGTLYAGGSFTVAGGAPASRVAAWDGTAWSPLAAGPSEGVNNAVSALAVDGTGAVVAGGAFTVAGGVPANRVARWDGAAWTPLGTGMDGPVQAVALTPHGGVVAAGSFTLAGGAPTNRIARWDGAAWSPLGAGVDNLVRALAHDRVSGVYAGGDFATAGGAPAARLARWQAPMAITLHGAEGWRMVGVPALGMSLDDVLGPLWTQGMAGSDAPTVDPDLYCNVFVHDESVRTDTNNDGVVSAADGWSCIPSLTGPSAPGRGVLVYVFADDDNDGTPDPFPKTLPLATGINPTVLLPYEAPDLSYTDSPLLPDVQEGFNYVANPSPLALDADAFAGAGLAATTYVWDATLYGGDWRTWNGAAGDLSNGVIPPAQGFFVQADNDAPALTIPVEATRTEGLPYYGRTAPPVLRIELSRDVDGTPTPEASAFVHLDAGGALGLDRLDGIRLTPMRWPYATLYTRAPGDASGTALVVSALPAAAVEASLPLGIATAGLAGVQRFTLSWDGFPSFPDGWGATLLDTATGEAHDLLAAGSVTVTETGLATGDAPAALSLRPQPLRLAGDALTGGERFVVRVAPRTVGTGGDAPVAFALEAPFPNPTRGTATVAFSLPSAATARVVLYDALGREVAVVADGTHVAGRHTAALPVRDLAAGLYLVRLTTSDGQAATRRLQVVR